MTDPSEPVVIHLKAGLQVTGRVLDHLGKGIAGVGVTNGTVNAQTDAQGRFILQGLKAGDVIVQVRPPKGFVRPKWQRVAAGTKDVEFRLERGQTIKGRAVDADGNPVKRGYVSARWEQTARSNQGSTGTQLGTDGSFTLDGIPDDVVVRIQVQVWNTAGGGGLAPAVVEGVRPGTDDLVLRLGGGLTIEGTVVDHRGKPGSNCHVYATAVADGRTQSGWVRVGNDGSWTISGLKAGRYRVMVSRQGGVAPKPQEVDAPATGLR